MRCIAGIGNILCVMRGSARISKHILCEIRGIVGTGKYTLYFVSSQERP